MLDALEDKELNFRFDERRLRGRKFNKTLNRLRNIFDKERHEIIEQEKYFGLMLDHVKTGIAVIEKDGRVTYCNNTQAQNHGRRIQGYASPARPKQGVGHA